MNERWKMNRIGFVNFWLYDEEDFEFEDGKLLLRGQTSGVQMLFSHLHPGLGISRTDFQ